jgi:hypothetical protein
MVLADQTLVGWIKFNGKGQPPDRDQGLLYGGFRMRKLDTLPDRDRSKWAIGLNSEPEDPWKHQMCLVLQGVDDMQLYTFATVNKTGRRACGELLHHYERVCRPSGEYPIVQLRPGGYNHPDKRVGWVPTPRFVVIGPKIKPSTTLRDDLNDFIPIL